MKRVVVTGGAGFIGSHLVEALLQQGHKLTVLDNFSTAPRSNLAAIANRINLIEGDACDPDTLSHVEDVDLIFHLAANADVPRSVREPYFDASTNILGTVNMLNLARSAGAQFVFASSGAVYGEPFNPPMAEDHRLMPISPYGVSKLAAEHYVDMYRRMYQVPTTILRIFNMYGPRQRRFVVSDLAHKIMKTESELVVLGSGRQIRSQLYVSDGVRAILTIADRGSKSIYNVGSAIQITIAELAQLMLKAFNTDKTIRFTQTSWQGDISRLVPDTKNLCELGFRETLTLEEGLHAFRAWFLSEYASVMDSCES